MAARSPTPPVFTRCTPLLFKNEALKWNHLVGFGFWVLAVCFVFRK